MRKFGRAMRIGKTNRSTGSLLHAIALTWLLSSAPAAGSEPSLVLQKSIPIPGVVGRIDHMDYDAAGGRLFVAALGNGSVEVLGVAASSVIASIRGLAEPQGIAFVADARKVYVTTGGSGELGVYDAASLGLLRRIQLGGDADNLHYDMAGRRLFISAGEAIRSLSVQDDVLSPAVALPGHPEGFALSPAQPLLYANVPVRGRGVFVIDRNRMSLLSRWPVGGPLANLFSNFPLALDENGRQLFVATRVPSALVVMDAGTGTQVATVRIDGDADDVFLDAARSRLYVSCGDGFIDVISRKNADSYALRDRIPTAAGARTSLWVAPTGTLYVAAPQRGDLPARILVFRAR